MWSVALLCSGRRGRELHHRPALRLQPEPRLAGDPGVCEQPGGEDGGDVLRPSRLLVRRGRREVYPRLNIHAWIPGVTGRRLRGCERTLKVVDETKHLKKKAVSEVER